MSSAFSTVSSASRIFNKIENPRTTYILIDITNTRRDHTAGRHSHFLGPANKLLSGYEDES
jgi:hypothetical protein